MEGSTRKNIFIAVLIVIAIYVAIWYFKKKKSDKKQIVELSLMQVPKEVLDKVRQVHADEAVSVAPDKYSFPLTIGSEGDNVKYLQEIMGMTPTGKLDKHTMDVYQNMTKDIGLSYPDKVSQAAIILIEGYAKSPQQFTFNIGDIVYANVPKLVIERVNVARNKKNEIARLQPTQDYKGFVKGSKLGVIMKVIGENQGLIKNDFGDYYMVKFDSIVKRG